MTKTKHEAALSRKAGCKRLNKKGLFRFNQLEGKNGQIQLSENSPPITDSPAPFSTSAKKILREIKSINTNKYWHNHLKEKTPTLIHHLKN